jgi:DNA-binding MarR family transcriptional regulator
MADQAKEQMQSRAEELLAAAATARRAFSGRPAGLEPSAVQVLMAAWAAPGCSVGAISGVLSMEPSTVSHALRALRLRGLLEAPEPGADARSRCYRVSAAGEEFVTSLLMRRTRQSRPNC